MFPWRAAVLAGQHRVRRGIRGAPCAGPGLPTSLPQARPARSRRLARLLPDRRRPLQLLASSLPPPELVEGRPLAWLTSRGGANRWLPACAAGAAAWLLRFKSPIS